jgi:hypothetical protein
MGDLTVPGPSPLYHQHSGGDTVRYSPNLARATYGGFFAMVLALILLVSPGYLYFGLFFLVFGAVLVAVGMIGAFLRGRK